MKSQFFIKPTLIVSILFCLFVFFLFSFNAFALDLEANCDEDDIRSKLDQISDAGGGKLTVAAGECTIDSTIYIPASENKKIEIVGQGIDKTIFNFDSTVFSNDFDVSPYENTYGQWGDIRISGISFLSTTTDQVNAISLYGVVNFQIDHCEFDGFFSSAGPILTKYTRMGLIDHCVFIEHETGEEGSPGYGVTAGGGYKDNVAYLHWEEERNKQLGTINAIYVEDNLFKDFSPAVIPNWGAAAKYVVRHNRFSSHFSGQQFSYKPGNYYFEFYNNHVEYTGPPDSPWGYTATRVFRLRAGGMIHNNTFKNYNGIASILSFASHGGMDYPVSSMTDNLFIWDNEYIWPHENHEFAANPNRVGECGVLYGAPWMIDDGSGSSSCDEGGKTGKLPLSAGDGPNDEIHFRAPRDGDEIYPYTPLEYPHPLSDGDSSQHPCFVDGGVTDCLDQSDAGSENDGTDETNCDCHTTGGTTPAFFVLLLVTLLFS